MSKEGFENEFIIAEYLNCKKFSDLNNNMRRFLKYLNENVEIDKNAHISSEALRSRGKADLIVSFNGIKKYISVKKGSGNSVHQEKKEFFIEFIEGLGASEEVKAFLIEFVDSEVDSKEFFKNNPIKRNAIQTFFNEHTEPLLVRFLKTGRFPSDHAEYIYHGIKSNGKFGKINDIIEYMVLHPSSGTAQLYVGGLTFQRWNTRPRDKAKRGVIQLKWPRIDDFLI